MSANPYLSIVIRTRNDDHGGNMLPRMQVSIDGLLEQLEKYRIETELILVEANPPVDKPMVKDILKWPETLRYCTIRVIVFPRSMHQKLPHAEKMPMYTVLAINCGVRRARGEFILPGAGDLLYNDELLAFIAQKKLKSDERYRINRNDVNREVLRYNTLKEQLEYCRNHIINSHAFEPRKPKIFKGRWGALPDLHVDASGDFQLMSKHNWHRLRGYRETDIIGTHCDSLLSFASYAAGVKEVILAEPMRLYHIDHDSKFIDGYKREKLPFEDRLSFSFMPAWFNTGIAGLYRRILALFGYKAKETVRGIPTLAYTDYLKLARDVVKGRRSYIYNDETWGLARESLEELVICTADWDKEYGKN